MLETFILFSSVQTFVRSSFDVHLQVIRCFFFANMFPSQRFVIIAIIFILHRNAKAEDECEKETDFMCRSEKKCIDSSLMCDKKFDCEDQSDEESCGKCSWYPIENFIKFSMYWKIELKNSYFFLTGIVVNVHNFSVELSYTFSTFDIHFDRLIFPCFQLIVRYTCFQRVQLVSAQMDQNWVKISKIVR